VRGVGGGYRPYKYGTLWDSTGLGLAWARVKAEFVVPPMRKDPDPTVGQLPTGPVELVLKLCCCS